MKALKVIMLETINQSRLMENGSIELANNKLEIVNGFKTPFVRCSSRTQHIYLTDPNAKIKEGDWCINNNQDTLYQPNCKGDLSGWNKIICSSNKYLLTCDGVKKQGESCTKNNNCIYPKCQVPQLSKQSIKLLFNYHNKNGKMPEDVEVEVIEDCGYKEGNCAGNQFLPCRINCPYWGYIKTSEDYWSDNYNKGTVDITIPEKNLKLQVFKLANKLALAGKGDAAVAMHGIHNKL